MSHFGFTYALGNSLMLPQIEEGMLTQTESKLI